MNADVLRMAGPFAGHDGAETDTQAPIALLPTDETGARMGAKPAEAEVRERLRGLLLLKPGWVFCRPEWWG